MALRSEVPYHPSGLECYRPLPSSILMRTRQYQRIPATLFLTKALSHMLVLFIALGLVGCSLSLDDGPAEAISLRAGQFGEAFNLRLAGTSKSGPLYFVDRHSSASTKQPLVFATALRSCTVTEEDSLLTVVRRLFVGLEGIRVVEREHRSMNSNAMAPSSADPDEQTDVSLVGIEATFDDQDIRICALSSIVDGCSVDVALWSIPEARPYDHTHVASLCHAVRDHALSTESTFWSNSFFEELASQ